jgi:hypothetical protein
MTACLHRMTRATTGVALLLFATGGRVLEPSYTAHTPRHHASVSATPAGIHCAN